MRLAVKYEARWGWLVGNREKQKGGCPGWFRWKAGRIPNSHSAQKQVVRVPHKWKCINGLEFNVLAHNYICIKLPVREMVFIISS